MPSTHRLSRRRFVGTVCGLAFAGSLAGCAGDETDDETTPEQTADGTSPGETDDGTDEATPAGGEATTTDTRDPDTATATDADGDSGGDGPTGDDLDRREANVVAVAVTQESDGRYRFEVTLDHDDDGEAGYANWWQVETRSGERMDRREFTNPHSEQPFTRSTTVDVPETVQCVVVRGHDQTHGYGGQAVVVSLETGATRTVDGGTEPVEVSAEDCP